MINSTVFLDTGFAIALLSPRDQYHAAVVAADDRHSVNITLD